MNDTSNNDFTAEEEKIISNTLAEHFGNPIEIQLADIEFCVNEGDSELTPCPAIYWEYGNCSFILAKAPDNKYFCQFFYPDNEQIRTEKPFYSDLHNCVVTLLQVQADHELKMSKKESA